MDRGAIDLPQCEHNRARATARPQYQTGLIGRDRDAVSRQIGGKPAPVSVIRLERAIRVDD